MSALRTTVLNREFQHPADGWYQIEVTGEHPNANAGIVQVVDAQAVQSMVAAFTQEAADYQARTGREFPGLCVDIEHFKHNPENETRAYGWLVGVQNRGGELYGKINWTGTGRPAVDGGDYRFFSTEYDPGDMEPVDNDPKRLRPLRLAGLTLTNVPNNAGGAPITNRGEKATPSIPDVPPSALDRWFAAVLSVQKSAALHGNVAIDWGYAWKLAINQFPELFNEAFGFAEQKAADDQMSVKSAADLVSLVSNRVAKAAGMPFAQAWQFTQGAIPAIYNRSNPRREQASYCAAWQVMPFVNPAHVLNRAQTEFSGFVNAEQRGGRKSFNSAFSAMKERHPELYGMAYGELTPDEAFERNPGLRNRLV